MIYTEKEKKAIEILKERVKDQIFWTDLGILNLGTLCSILEKQQKEIKELTVSNKELDKECSRLERKEVKMQKEIDRLKGLKVVIGGMRSGKQLLKEIANDYLELVLKENKLQCISGYSIDYIIDLFERGFALVDEEDYISKEKIRDLIKEFEKVTPEDREVSKVTIDTSSITYEFKENLDYKIAQRMIKLLQDLLEE